MAKDKKYFKRTVEAPADVLEKSVEAAQRLESNLPPTHMVKRGKDYWHTLGPGLTTGASDDDPSGIATYSQAGAQFGFGLLWMSAYTFPLMSMVQEMCGRIGLVTGRGLAGNIRLRFSRRVLYAISLMLFAANTFNLGADLGAMAKAAQLLNPAWNFTVLVIGFGLLSLFLQIFTPYARYARYLKWLAMVLFTYIASALLAHLSWSSIVHFAFIPHLTFTKDELLLICAILGTTISPYLFFWQTSQEVEERVMAGKTTVQLRKGTTKKQIKNMRTDIWSGMLLSNLVMFFIIAACGALLYTNGIQNINSAAQAAEALRPFAGQATYFLFAAGIIGTGLLAVPVLAGSASYAVAESFGWREGLYQNLKHAKAFYGVIIIAMLVGLGINFIGLNPIKTLIYAAVFNGLVAPIVLAAIVIISSDKKIMGQWVNSSVVKLVGWGITAVMVLAGGAAIWSLF